MYTYVYMCVYTCTYLCTYMYMSGKYMVKGVFRVYRAQVFEAGEQPEALHANMNTYRSIDR